MRADGRPRGWGRGGLAGVRPRPGSGTLNSTKRSSSGTAAFSSPRCWSGFSGCTCRWLVHAPRRQVPATGRSELKRAAAAGGERRPHETLRAATNSSTSSTVRLASGDAVLERSHPDRRAGRPRLSPEDEVARFRPQLSLAFPPSQIAELGPPSDERPNPLVTVTFFGLYTASPGFWPVHYTQMMMDLIRDVRGPERRSAAGLVSTSSITEPSRSLPRRGRSTGSTSPTSAASAYGTTPDTFTLAVRSLMGLGSAGPHPTGSRLLRNAERGMRRGRQKPQPILCLRMHTPHSLGSMISDCSTTRGCSRSDSLERHELAAAARRLLRVAVEVCQFRGQWLPIPEADQTRNSDRSAPSA